MTEKCSTCTQINVCEITHLAEEEDFVCKTYEEVQPMTLNDRINQMTAEEKAEWIWNHDEVTAKNGRLTKASLLSFLTKPLDPPLSIRGFYE